MGTRGGRGAYGVSAQGGRGGLDGVVKMFWNWMEGTVAQFSEHDDFLQRGRQGSLSEDALLG